MQRLPENEKKKNCLCVRWNDASMQRVCDEAYSKRISCSELVRDIVLERLQTKDAIPEQKQNV